MCDISNPFFKNHFLSVRNIELSSKVKQWSQGSSTWETAFREIITADSFLLHDTTIQKPRDYFRECRLSYSKFARFLFHSHEQFVSILSCCRPWGTLQSDTLRYAVNLVHNIDWREREMRSDSCGRYNIRHLSIGRMSWSCTKHCHLFKWCEQRTRRLCRHWFQLRLYR